MPLNSETAQSIQLPISGVILAGGRSRRFGQDKASYIYKGKRMLDWSLESLSIAQERFIIANKSYSSDIQIYPDIRTDCSDTGCGPMGGLYTALQHAKNEWVALAACDMPNLTSRFWRALHEQIDLSNAQHAVVIKSADARLQTLAAFYNKSILPIIEIHLDNNTIALQSLADYFTIVSIDDLDDSTSLTSDLFLNFNYLEDVKQ